MKISRDIRDEADRVAGLAAKSVEFTEMGATVYVPEDAVAS